MVVPSLDQCAAIPAKPAGEGNCQTGDSALAGGYY